MLAAAPILCALLASIQAPSSTLDGGHRGSRVRGLAGFLGAASGLEDRLSQGPYWSSPFTYGETASDPSSQYNGRVYDPSTGLHDYGARLYWPEIGRFISADSVMGEPGSPASLNRYSYVLNNPYKYVDPTGRYPGQLPPAPPGFNPKTWGFGNWANNGKFHLIDPDGRTFTIHPEDDGHWRHWDIQGPGGKGGGKWPSNPDKPEENRRRPPKANQSPTDPNGDEPEWKMPDQWTKKLEEYRDPGKDWEAPERPHLPGTGRPIVVLPIPTPVPTPTIVPPLVLQPAL